MRGRDRAQAMFDRLGAARIKWDRHLAAQFLDGQSVIEVAVENSMRPDAVEEALRRELRRRDR